MSLRPIHLLSGLLLLAATACFDFQNAYEDCVDAGQCTDQPVQADASGADAVDSGPVVNHELDAGAPDGGSPGTEHDAGSSDAGALDPGSSDAGVPGPVDAGSSDAGAPGPIDAGPPDSGSSSPGPDAGPPCTADLCLLDLHLVSNRAGMIDIWANDPDFVVAVGDTDTVVVFTDGGFSEWFGPSPYSLDQVGGTSRQNVWAVGEASDARHFNGSDWVEIPSPNYSQVATGIWPLPDGGAVIAMQDQLHRYTGSGWAQEGSTANTSMRGLWGSSDGQRAWAMSQYAHASVRLFAYQTQTWSSSTMSEMPTIESIHGADPDLVWAVGGAGHAIRLDGGAWERVDAGTTEDLWDVWVAPNGQEVWSTGSDGKLRRWRPTTGWVLIKAPGPSVSYWGVYGASNGDLWVSGGYFDMKAQTYDGGHVLRFHRQP